MSASIEPPSSPSPRAFGTPLYLILATLAGAFFFEVERQRSYDEKLWGGYGTPLRVTAVDALGTPSHVVLTESRLEAPPARWQEKCDRYCTWWSFAAERVLLAPLGSIETR